MVKDDRLNKCFSCCMKTCVDLEILSASVLEQEKVLPLSRCPEELHRLDDGFLRVYVRKLSVENAVPKKIRRLSRGFRCPTHIKINTPVTQYTSGALHALDSSLKRC